MRFVGPSKQPNIGSTADVSRPLSGPAFTIIRSGSVHRGVQGFSGKRRPLPPFATYQFINNRKAPVQQCNGFKSGRKQVANANLQTNASRTHPNKLDLRFCSLYENSSLSFSALALRQKCIIYVRTPEIYITLLLLYLADIKQT